MCKEFIKRNDFEILQSLEMVETEQEEILSGVLGKYLNFELRLRCALALKRSQKLGIEIESFSNYVKPDHEQTLLAEEAFHAPSPLKAEEILNKARWRYLDELEFGHYFDRDRLFIFGIKLQILERIALFNAERGLQTLNSILNLDKVKANYFNAFAKQ